MKIRPGGFPETSATCYFPTLHNSSETRRFHPYSSGGLKLHRLNKASIGPRRCSWCLFRCAMGQRVILQKNTNVSEEFATSRFWFYHEDGGCPFLRNYRVHWWRHTTKQHPPIQPHKKKKKKKETPNFESFFFYKLFTSSRTPLFNAQMQCFVEI
jgi:hypothetical protein